MYRGKLNFHKLKIEGGFLVSQRNTNVKSSFAFWTISTGPNYLILDLLDRRVLGGYNGTLLLTVSS